METKIILIKDARPNYYLTDILIDNGYHGFLPGNTIINKRRPSIGATYCELHAERHSILIEPFVTVIEVKKQKLGDKICAVMKKDFKIEDLVSYLNEDQILYKKIVTTPESFTKVIRALKKHDAQYRKHYFLLIDECDKLIQHALFRERIFTPMDEFFLFENKAMVSATPIIPSSPEFERQGFIQLDLKPTFDYKKTIKLFITNNINSSLRNVVKQLKIKKDSKPVFLFTNCKRSILYFTRLEEVKDNFKIFCAEDLNEKFFKINKTANVENSVTSQSYADYNAFTSRFFAGVDIEPHDYAHIIIVTNVPHVPHSIVDPMTEAIQICGRDRLQAKEVEQKGSITHITNLYPKDISGGNIETEKELFHIERLQDLAEKSTHPVVREFIKTQIDKELLAQALRSDGSVEPFLKDNYEYVKTNKALYQSKEALFNAYTKSGYFNPVVKTVMHPFSDKDELALARAKGGIARNKAFINLLQKLLTNYDPLNTDQEDVNYILRQLENDNRLLFNAYGELGYDQIVKLGYAKTKIKEAIFQIKSIEGNNAFLMIDKIQAEFKLNIKIYGDDIKTKLQAIYHEFNYENSKGEIHNAKAADIQKYFNCKLYNGKEKIDGVYRSYYRLFSFVDKISNDLAYMLN